MKLTVVLVTLITAVNIAFHRPIIESLLFALALAVGLTPQLLPAIITINLARGAKIMATKKVIVKKLNSIENFGSMDILCTDKTGTLTTGLIELVQAVDISGQECPKTLSYASLNAAFQMGYVNPIDQAIQKKHREDIRSWHKCDEVPYDFSRKRLSILIEKDSARLMITKGSFQSLLEICNAVEDPSGRIEPIDSHREELKKIFEMQSLKGFHILSVAYRLVDQTLLDYSDESGMIFLGFLLFSDPPKKEALETLHSLTSLGISFKMLTGDHQLVATQVAMQVGMSDISVVTGSEIESLRDEDLIQIVEHRNIFAEMLPTHKERVVKLLRSRGHVVGVLGDGINDLPAMHAADVSISVDTAAGPAKAAADIVLLSKNLTVLGEGVKAGRITFANTLKYIFMATSANFGNMFSMAGASLFLNFLPLLPKQILLINLMTDGPEMTIATDRVDSDWIQKPIKWNIRFIGRFMITFGLISSLFDFLTFGMLALYFKAPIAQFRTGWFIESVTSASIIVLAIRTFHSFYLSKPSRSLFYSVCFIALMACLMPWVPHLSGWFELVPLPYTYFIFILLVIILYVFSIEVLKRKLLKNNFNSEFIKQ